MKKIEIFKNKYGLYSYSKSKIDDIELRKIYIFLSHDYVDLSFFLEWLNNKNEKLLGTNLCFIEKDGENLILGCNSNYEHKNIFKTKKEYFIEMLKQWEKVCAKMPKRVVIKLDDSGKVTLEYDKS